MPSLSVAERNALMDFRWRGQSLAPRSSIYWALMRVLPTPTTPGTELSVGAGDTGYARQAMTLNLANISGTQGDGTTTVSSGTRDYVTNNVSVQFSAALAAAWPGIAGYAVFAAASGGSPLDFGPITDDDGNPIVITRNIGEPVVFAPGRLRLYTR